MVDARENTVTPVLSWFRPMRPYVQQGEGYCIILHRSGRSRGYKLVWERERSSQVPGSAGVIEASANIGRGERACVFCLCVTASSFCRPRREGEGYTCRMSMGSSLLPLIWGRTVGRPCHQVLWSMASGVVIVLANPPAVPRARPCPVAPVVSVTVATERTVPALDVVGHLGHHSPWPCPGQEPYRVRGSSPMAGEGPAGEKSTRAGGIVSRRCQASPRRVPRRE
jgi:hypothetical protein